MSRTLHLHQEYWTLRGGLSLRDDTGAVVCEARGGFSWISPTWSVYRDGHTVATVRQKIFAWRPAWRVDGELGAFMIRCLGRASDRGYEVTGGRFEGVRLSRMPREQALVLAGRDGEVARSRGEEIELEREDADAALLLAIALAVYHMDRMSDASRR